MKRLLLCVCSVIAAAVVVLSVGGNKSEKQAELLVKNVEALSDPEIYCGAFCVDDEGLCVYYYIKWDLVDIYDGTLLPYYG